MSSKYNSQTQSQVQSQTQMQTLSPQQMLEVQLLQLNVAGLENRIQAELLDNEALEISDGAEDRYDDTPASDDGSDSDSPDGWGDITEHDDHTADYLSPDDIPDYSYDPSAPKSVSAQAAEIPISDSISFYDTIREQLGEHDLTPRQRVIAEYIIGSLNDDGLLDKTLSAISTEMAVQSVADADESEIEEVLGIIQQFDPPGIGARDLRECLLIQLRRKSPSAIRDLAVRIVNDSLDDVRNKRPDRCARRLGADLDDVSAAFDLIMHLNPRPGNTLGETEGRGSSAIIPDFFVQSYDGAVQTTLLTGGIPRLRVSPSFTQTLDAQIRGKDSDVRNAAQFIRRQIDGAQGFINAIQQRERTLTRIIRAIARRQEEYFATGDESRLRPMILKDIADDTGFDISTVSRAVSGKYADTEFGLVSLKSLFTDGVASADGSLVSVREIHRILREAVSSEKSSDPLTDGQLADILAAQGYVVARRTVAKYREQLGIPVSRLRRK